MIQAVLMAMLASLASVPPANESRSGPQCQTTGKDEITITCSYTAKPRSAWGEPSASIACTPRPQSCDASSAGLPMVALVKQNVGEDP